MPRLTLAFTILLTLASISHAKVVTKSIPYEHDGQKLEGFLAWDDSTSGQRPGVLVVHEWWGLNDYARARAEKLAKLGYVAFALDMYGKGKVTKHPSEAGKWATEIRQNIGTWRKRAEAGLQVLKGQELVDTQQMAAVGYCFGGATVLQLAYDGADLDAVVSFHGSLPIPDTDKVKKIGPKILVCHGADDSFTPEPQIQKFRDALKKTDADWQIVYYAGARHGFTNPGAGEYGLEPLKYNKHADGRSWNHMRLLFGEVFRKP